MPQHRIKMRQVTITAGTKLTGILGDVFNASGVKQGSSKLITKAQSNVWPGADWIASDRALQEVADEEPVQTQSTQGGNGPLF